MEEFPDNDRASCGPSVGYKVYGDLAGRLDKDLHISPEATLARLVPGQHRHRRLVAVHAIAGERARISS